MRTRTLLLVLIPASAAGFQFPTLPNPFKPPSSSSSSASAAFVPKTSALVSKQKSELLEAVSNTNNGKSATPEQQQQVLSIVGALEKTAPVSDTLLSDPQEAKKLDGVWYLQYTSPSVVGDTDEFPNEWKPDNASENESIETRKFQAKGTVAAVGLTVDTANRVVQQIFDVDQSTVMNQVELDFGQVTVGGSFRQSSTVPNRAVVAFETGQIAFSKGFTLKLDAIFSILAFLRGGNKDSGWLETTFLDDEIRIGRGNKGTMFVLTRDPQAVKP